jgi:hypothetical protein
MTRRGIAEAVLNARRRRGPACGRRYLVNSTFDAADCFYRSLYGGSWVGERRGMARYRALWRVWRRLRGEDGGTAQDAVQMAGVIQDDRQAVRSAVEKVHAATAGEEKTVIEVWKWSAW